MEVDRQNRRAKNRSDVELKLFQPLVSAIGFWSAGHEFQISTNRLNRKTALLQTQRITNSPYHQLIMFVYKQGQKVRYLECAGDVLLYHSINLIYCVMSMSCFLQNISQPLHENLYLSSSFILFIIETELYLEYLLYLLDHLLLAHDPHSNPLPSSPLTI